MTWGKSYQKVCWSYYILLLSFSWFWFCHAVLEARFFLMATLTHFPIIMSPHSFWPATKLSHKKNLGLWIQQGWIQELSVCHWVAYRTIRLIQNYAKTIVIVVSLNLVYLYILFFFASSFLFSIFRINHYYHFYGPHVHIVPCQKKKHQKVTVISLNIFIMPFSSFACHAHETWDSWKHQLLPPFCFFNHRQWTGRKCVWSIVVKCCAILIRGTHGVAVRENDSDVAQKCIKYASTYHGCALIVYKCL